MAHTRLDVSVEQLPEPSNSGCLPGRAGGPPGVASFESSIEFQGRVERIPGLGFSSAICLPMVVYRAEVNFELRSGSIIDSTRTSFADSALLTLELGSGGLDGSTAGKFNSVFGLTLGDHLQLDFGTGNPLATGKSALQLHPGLTLDLFDSGSGSISGSFASVSLLNATLAPGAVLNLSSLSSEGIVRVVQAAAVPEPDTWASMLAGLAALAGLSLRRWPPRPRTRLNHQCKEASTAAGGVRSRQRYAYPYPTTRLRTRHPNPARPAATSSALAGSGTGAGLSHAYWGRTVPSPSTRSTLTPGLVVSASRPRKSKSWGLPLANSVLPSSIFWPRMSNAAYRLTNASQ
jgi:hypothetical protein